MSASAPLVDQLALNTFEGLLKFLWEPEGQVCILSPKRFGSVFNLDIQTLARQAHVHRNTITRTPGAESVQRFLRDALRVVSAAADASGNVRQAIFWYRNHPLPPFGYKTAEMLLEAGRTEDVLHYIASLEAGVAG